MKKIIITLSLCLSIATLHCQNFGETHIPHPGSICSAGLPLSINAPNYFLMAGYRATTTAGMPNFYIDKIRSGGTFSLLSFSNEYFINATPNCSGQPLPALFTGSISVIETNVPAPSTARFALAGLIAEGCFFSTLDVNGLPLNSMLYPFPSGSSGAQKPLIVESTSIANQYFITGSYNNGTQRVMYILRVDAVGTVLDSREYVVQGDLFPTAMIMSPYSLEVVIVGQVVASGVSAGFFMQVSPFNLANITQSVRYSSTAANGSEYFSAIAIANSPVGGVGFVVGGYLQAISSTTPGNVWMLKLNPAGAVIWSNISEPTTDPLAKHVIDVVERFSLTYGYTYYAAVGSSVGMMVLKFDSILEPFAGPAGSIDDVNEFIYTTNSPPQEHAANISFLTGAPLLNDGIQVYGTDNRTLGGNHYFVEAAFNGVSGCNSIFKHTVKNPIPLTLVPFFISTPVGLSACSNFNIIANLVTATPTPTNFCRFAAMPGGGSNSRGTTTGLVQDQADKKEFQFYPNPVNDKLTISFTAENNSGVSVQLYDGLGHLVHEQKTATNNGAQSVALDLAQLNLESGLYMVSVSVDGIVSKQKIVYQKN